MKDTTLKDHGFVAFLMMSFACSTFAQPDAHEPRWFGELDSQNRRYLKVDLDCQNLPSNQYIDGISFEFVFYNAQGQVISMSKIRFINEPVEGLNPGFYKLKLNNPQQGASSVKGAKLTFVRKVRGAALQGAISTVQAKENALDAPPAGSRTVVIGAPAASLSDYAGFWRNTDSRLKFIQFLEIVPDGPGRLRIRSWLRCDFSRSGGIVLRNCQSWGEDRVSSTNPEKIEWTHNEVYSSNGTRRTNHYKNILTLDGETLQVFTQLLQGSNYFRRGTRPSQ